MKRDEKLEIEIKILWYYIHYKFIKCKDIELPRRWRKRKPVNTLIGLIRSIYLPTSLKK